MYDILEEFQTRKTFAARQQSPLFIPELLTEDNKKLVSNDMYKFIRWNIPAVITCPFKTLACEKSCYAKRPEGIYPNTRESRYAAWQVSEANSFVDRMIYTILVHLDRPIFKGKKAIIRIHESGDFYSYEYLIKWLQIISAFKGDKRVIFCAYTKSIPFFHQAGLYTKADIQNIYPNLVLSASKWADMTPETLEAMNQYKTYTAYTPEEIKRRKEAGEKFHVCRCKDCGSCLACMTYKIKDTVCVIH